MPTVWHPLTLLCIHAASARQRRATTNAQGVSVTVGTFHFDLGDSNDGPIGFSAEIRGVDTGAAALDVLRAALPENAEIDGFDDERIGYVTVYFNCNEISVRDIDESETGEGCCEYCGRSEDEPHTDDCESALAQDLSLGEITIKDDSYSDAVSAFETVYGRPFS